MPADNFTPLIIIIVAAAILLVVVGVILALRPHATSAAASEPAAGDKPAPERVKGVTRDSAASVPAEAILVLRDPVSSEWVVEVNGMRYAQLKDIHDDRAASKVLAALSGLQRFAGTIPIIKPELRAPLGAAPAAPTKNLEPSVAQAMKPGGAVSAAALRPAPPNSILDQIEKILQHNLLRYPEFAERRIHVGAAEDSSLLIEVDRHFYQHADDVPDLMIRGVIKAAIQEWERST